MLEFLPKDIAEGLIAGTRRDQKRRSRLRAQVGEAVFPILRLWEDGIALDAEFAPQLRGFIDVYDGANHILQALIVTSILEDGQVICEFKRSTVVKDTPPRDFIQDEEGPAGYLPRN